MITKFSESWKIVGHNLSRGKAKRKFFSIAGRKWIEFFLSDFHLDYWKRNWILLNANSAAFNQRIFSLFLSTLVVNIRGQAYEESQRRDKREIDSIQCESSGKASNKSEGFGECSRAMGLFRSHSLSAKIQTRTSDDKSPFDLWPHIYLKRGSTRGSFNFHFDFPWFQAAASLTSSKTLVIMRLLYPLIQNYSILICCENFSCATCSAPPYLQFRERVASNKRPTWYLFAVWKGISTHTRCQHQQ